MKLLLIWPNRDSFGVKPIGLSLLSAIAKNLNCETRLFDTTPIDFGYVDNISSGESARIFKPVDLSSFHLEKYKLDLTQNFTNVFKGFKPDCLAFSVLSDEYQIADKIGKIAKDLDSNVTIIWGGKYPTLNPEKTLKIHNADFVCVGEGLEAFSEFLEAFQNRGALYSISNIWAKRKGKIIKNNVRPLKAVLDDLPFVDWEIFDKRHFIRPFDGKVYIGGDHMLNWGCPYHCTYCINHFYHNLYNNKYFVRRYKVDRIIEELKFLKRKYNLTFFRFYDEDFLMRPLENLRELGESYSKGVGLPFIIETNPKSVTKEKVSILKKMNCVGVTIAIENGDMELRKNMLKRVDSEHDILVAFSLFREFGIRTSSFNLFGIPFESRQIYFKTVELNRKASVQYPSIGFFYPFEGTELRQASIESGFLIKMRKNSLFIDEINPLCVLKI